MDMCGLRRVIGDNYIMGPRIGWGSFAVVWRARHRQSGLEVAVKEIDIKKQLKVGMGDHNLLKEISILSNIRHPNIIRLFEAFQTEDKIYLVLEYCDGGDLAAYIHRHGGKVNQHVASHFMRQLAAGLKVLNENCLIHRDLKPQNILLSTNEPIPVLKIGDFGFARYLTPQGLADTMCGSPLYMAPEIIQNKKYDGKADLWSAGAILFQLVTGKPPFDGDNQFQLFQNILTSCELRFPQGALEVLHPDCVDLCRSLLRQNPVERLPFEEFYNNKFLALPRNSELISSLHDEDNEIPYRKVHDSKSSSKGVDRFMSDNVCDRPTRPTASLEVSNSMDFIEKDYVFVNAHSASMENFSCSLETFLLNSSLSRVFSYLPLKNARAIVGAMKMKEPAANSIGSAKGLQSHELASISNIMHHQAHLPYSGKFNSSLYCTLLLGSYCYTNILIDFRN